MELTKSSKRYHSNIIKKQFHNSGQLSFSSNIVKLFNQYTFINNDFFLIISLLTGLEVSPHNLKNWFNLDDETCHMLVQHGIFVPNQNQKIIINSYPLIVHIFFMATTNSKERSGNHSFQEYIEIFSNELLGISNSSLYIEPDIISKIILRLAGYITTFHNFSNIQNRRYNSLDFLFIAANFMLDYGNSKDTHLYINTIEQYKKNLTELKSDELKDDALKYADTILSLLNLQVKWQNDKRESWKEGITLLLELVKEEPSVYPYTATAYIAIREVSHYLDYALYHFSFSTEKCDIQKAILSYIEIPNIYFKLSSSIIKGNEESILKDYWSIYSMICDMLQNYIDEKPISFSLTGLTSEEMESSSFTRAKGNLYALCYSAFILLTTEYDELTIWKFVILLFKLEKKIGTFPLNIEILYYCALKKAFNITSNDLHRRKIFKRGSNCYQKIQRLHIVEKDISK